LINVTGRSGKFCADATPDNDMAVNAAIPSNMRFIVISSPGADMQMAKCTLS
jgi:hypothetical protein